MWLLPQNLYILHRCIKLLAIKVKMILLHQITALCEGHIDVGKLLILLRFFVLSNFNSDRIEFRIGKCTNTNRIKTIILHKRMKCWAKSFSLYQFSIFPKLVVNGINFENFLSAEKVLILTLIQKNFLSVFFVCIQPI